MSTDGLTRAFAEAEQPNVELGELDLAEPPELAPAPGDSVIADLRRRAAALRAERTTDIPIPGFGGSLVGRYHAVSAARLYTTPGGTPRNPIGDWRLAADALAIALDGLYSPNRTTGVLEPIFTDVPGRYDDDLIAFLDLPAPVERTARAVMVEVFGGAELGESRIWAHFMAYQGWLMAGSDDGEPPPEVNAALGSSAPAA